MYYWISLVSLIVFYVIGVLVIFKYNKKSKFVNSVFSMTIFLLYLFCLVSIYLDVGFYDWNFQNALPTGNMSPFMYTLVFISLVLPQNIKKYVFSLVGLLSFPMLCAGLISCIGYIIRDYTFHLTIFLDAFIHVLLSIFGVYLAKSKQIDFKNNKVLIISGGLILLVANIMIIVNLIFKTAFFGLSMYGDHYIYNLVLVESSIFNAIIYILGAVIVLFIGYFYQKILNKSDKVLSSK